MMRGFDSDLDLMLDIVGEIEKNTENVNQFGKKSSATSIEVRKMGNDLYSKKKHSAKTHFDIMGLYNKSIAFAPIKSEALASSFGNRSMLMLHMKEYENCVKDIDRALEITSSNLLKAKLTCRKVKALKLLGKIKESEALIESARGCINLLEKEDEYWIEKLAKELESVRILSEDMEKEELQKFELPEFTRSKETPSASEDIEIKYRFGYERHIVAKRSISTGEILIVEDCFIVSANSNHRYITCSHCLKFSFTNIPCEGCSLLMYCSENCKYVAYQEYHSIECKILPLFFIDNKKELHGRHLAILRIVIKALKEYGYDGVKKEMEAVDNCKDKRIKGFSDEGIFHSHQFRSIYSLYYQEYIHNESITPRVLKKLFSTMVKIIFSYTKLLGDCQGDVDEESDYYKTLNKLFFKLSNISSLNGITADIGIESNCFCFIKEKSNKHKVDCIKERGGTLSAVASLINHSCHPNVDKLFVDGKIVFYCCRPIKKDEQIFQAYRSIHEFKNVHERIQEIGDYYHFGCTCEACNDDWPVPKTLEEFQPFMIKLMEDKKVNKLIKGIKYITDHDLSDAKDLFASFNDICKFIDLMYATKSSKIAYLATNMFKWHLKLLFERLYLQETKVPIEC